MKPSLRISILHRDSYTCQYCGRRAPQVKLHVDHVISLKDGGANHPSNLVAACQDCNLGKSRRSLRIEPEVAHTADVFFLDFPAPDPATVRREVLLPEAPPRDPAEWASLMSSLDRAHWHSIRAAWREETNESIRTIEEEYTDA